MGWLRKLLGLSEAQVAQLERDLDWQPRVKDVCGNCGHSHLNHHLRAPHCCNGPWSAENPFPGCNCPGWLDSEPSKEK